MNICLICIFIISNFYIISGLQGYFSPATRCSWKIQPMSAKKEFIILKLQFSKEQFELIKKGIVPEEMEEKWFIYFDDGRLYMHRSWTGFLAYECLFEEKGDFIELIGFWANRKHENGFKEEECKLVTKLLFNIYSINNNPEKWNKRHGKCLDTEKPLYIFKILKLTEWDKVKGREFIKLCNENSCTFASEEQYSFIKQHFWKHDFVGLKLDTNKLPGDLYWEKPWASTMKYYKILQNCLPAEAIIEVQENAQSHSDTKKNLF